MNDYRESNLPLISLQSLEQWNGRKIITDAKKALELFGR